jgi:hypothetical protein
MWTKLISFPLSVVLASLSVVAACSPNMSTPQPGVPATSGPEQTSVVTSPASSGEGVSQAGEPADGKPDITGGGESRDGKGVVYDDSRYKFSVVYPSGFKVRTRKAGQLALQDPRPVAAFLFMNPVAANSEAPDEPGDLEVQIYSQGGAASLERWLKSAGFLANGEGLPATYRTEHLSGMKVCRSTMIVPNCFYFFMGNGWIYRVTTMTLSGNEMLNSFKLTK